MHTTTHQNIKPHQILGELKHANLVELLDVRVTVDGLELVLDFCETDLKKASEGRRR